MPEGRARRGTFSEAGPRAAASPPPQRRLVRRARGPAPAAAQHRLDLRARPHGRRHAAAAAAAVLASVEAVTKTAPGRTQLRAPSLDTALSVTDVDLGAVLLGDESSDDDDDDYEAPAPYNQLRSKRDLPRRRRVFAGVSSTSSRKNRRRHVVKLQLIPDLSPRVTAYLERGDDAEVAPTPASGLRLVVGRRATPTSATRAP